ncbi:MAG: hypothetical protein AB1916_10760 [Thermodesulfobacteriota bacterium]
MTMRPDPDDLHAPGAEGDDSECVDLVARARSAVLEMRRQAAASGLDAVSEADGPGEGGPGPKSRRKKKGAARRAA